MSKKVIVIDDKPLIVKSIVQTIDWERLDCEVVGHAEDGLEGERLILELCPDILITDIRMPGHNGLYLSEIMQTRFPESKTILITGYQEFEFAQRAVRLGAFDFIVKPIHNDHLFKVVEAAVLAIEDAKSSHRAIEKLSREYSDLKQRHDSSIPSLRSKWITDLIAGKKEGVLPSFQSVQKELGIIPYGRFSLIAVEPQPLNEQDRKLLTADYRNQIVEAVRSSSLHDDLQIIDAYWNDKLLFVCLFPRVPTTREARIKLQTLAADWLKRIHQLSNRRWHIAVGNIRKSLEELGEAYREVKGLMESGFFRGEEEILLLNASPIQRETGKFSIIDDLEQFNRILEESSVEDVIRSLEKVLKQIQVYSEGNILVVKALLSEVCLSTARYYFRLTGDEFGLGKSVDQILDDVFRLNSLKEASEYLSNWIGIVKRKAEGREKEYSLIVKKTIDYINTHFPEAINLTSVAHHFGISSSYLSRLIRLETGINFVDLVSKARIEAAKRLLRDPKYKVSEVGEMVGYKEYAYFYQVFKRISGQSPKEYKNGIVER